MITVVDSFKKEIFVGSLVAISTNSGMYVGRVTKFNVITYDGVPRLTTVQVQLTEGKKRSYDGPEWRMINLDEVHEAVKEIGL